MLVQYLIALESAFDGLLDDLMAAHIETLTRPHSRNELLHPAPPRSCPSSSASCTPPAQLRLQLPLIEEFNKVIAPTSIRAAIPASPFCASPYRAVLLEPMLEEVDSPAPDLGLSLGQPIQVPSDST